jgi:uncharacterized membrane protein YbhN (UPF0104 family)
VKLAATLRHPRTRTIAGAAISAVCLAAVIWWIASQPAPRWPRGEDLWWLVPVLALDAANYTLRGYRWHRVMCLAGIEHARSDAYALNVVGYMGNNVLPARGGEFLRIGLLAARSPASRVEIAGSVVAERTLDAAALVLLFTGFALFGVAGAPGGAVPGAIGGGVLLLGGAGLALYVRARRRGRLERFAARVRPLARGARVMVRPEGAVLAVLSVLIWLLQAAAFLCIGRSIGVQLDAVEGTAILVASSIVALVPAAPGYAGTFDAGLGFGLAAVGVTGGAAVGFLLLARFMIFVPVTLAGAALMLVRYRTAAVPTAPPRSAAPRG